ncbi:hypothetical protein ABT033_38005 [Streptomyces pharetrae]|uniref:hypothetical protein n=1 Tax=Streptomyces pharetrae TaxID=291370 RepID=UPI0033620383
MLRVLGVLKVATVEQIQQISTPHLSYRHTDKPTPAKRKQARTASHPGALSDLRKHGRAENGGQIPGGDRLRNLTPMGLKAAARELGRPVGEMGDPARGAGRTGASHSMTVNEAVLALLRPKPDLSQLASEPADVFAAAQAAVDAPDGLGTIASYATEVALPVTGTWSNRAGVVPRRTSCSPRPRTGCRCCSLRSTTASSPRRSSLRRSTSTCGSASAR